MRDRSDFRRRAAGNLLLDYGLSRHCPAGSSSECSEYTTRLADGGEVWLWGCVLRDLRAAASAIARPRRRPSFSPIPAE